MKRKLYGLTALVLCTALLCPTATADAAYENKEDVAFTLRSMETENCGYTSAGEENITYVTAESAEEGVTLHYGVYIEAAYADLAFLSMKLQSDSENITFSDEGYHNPTTYYSDEALTYTLSDGTTFSTRLKPYCLGKLNSMGVYTPDSLGVAANFNSTENTLTVNWIYGYSDTSTLSAGFLGSTSDEFSFIEFDVKLAPGTAAGTYHLSFVDDEEYTYITSDDSTDGKSLLVNTVPTLKTETIVVLDTDYILATDTTPVFRLNDDTEVLSINDVFPDTDSVQILHALTDGSFETLEVSTDSISLSQYGGQSPSVIAADETLPCYTEDTLLFNGEKLSGAMDGNAAAEIYIGLKGDANLDGTVDAADAATVLTFAAYRGAGGFISLVSQELSGRESGNSHLFAYYLADVNGQSRNGGADGSALDAGDAANILQYAAIAGSGITPEWDTILN
jgi:hypothetical protein